ncbi:EAL domain-containing protein [Luteimonas sp. FCS-9]|uniref:putative bifunctional diguanylate cyclase/phosphodiesterase n=1 Tax=Luteimonas sp. FCS-9 TaxID=1547516 RepID=UPI00063E848E|nr:EAL domain-containing protein [Luteimonas sp. FCS-9]KLJ01933.1 diguanylate cyclase [Luteimonas sp. FCS-9]
MGPVPFPIPPDEALRASTLADYHVLDAPAEPEFDRLVQLASRLFSVPIVLISLVTRDRQVFKARVGLEVCETERDVSFCAHAILQDDVMVVPDALEDPRFAANPLVLGPPFIRFYAGKPLVTPGGQRLGTVCLIDTQPRQEFSQSERDNLSDIAELVMDRMELTRLEYMRAIGQARFENIAATSPDAIICTTDTGQVTFWNHAAERLFGYAAEEATGRCSSLIVPDSWREAYFEDLARLRDSGTMEAVGRTIVRSGLRRDGSEFPAEISLSSWQEGRARSVGAIVRDITERRRNEDRLYRLASLDALTELPNRAAWRACIHDALAQGTPVSVLLLDLDGFKDVNDTLGHSAGDQVLKTVAARLKAECPDALMVARLGGDEFVLLLAGDDRRAASAVAGGVVRALSRPYALPGHAFEIGASVGIALYPAHGARAEDLLGAADLALYRAKAAGKGRYVLFEPAFREVAVARREFERELRRAFEQDQFVLLYQPQVDTRDGRIRGAEALLRWQHPTRGMLSPVSFIDVLAQKPIAPAVGEWILRTACGQARAWRERVPGFRIGVNLFEAQLRSGQLRNVVERVLHDTGLPPEALELELLENIMMRNDGATLKLLQALRTMGVGLAFDDYGTGFASLSLLKRFPVSRLKIDRSFIRDVISDPEDAAIVRAVIYLGRSFGLEVIAEGVETKAQLDFLVANHCSHAQGYLFGRPMSAQALTSELGRAAVLP